MGEVYRAHDHELGRAVAIKILPRAFAESGDRLRRFELEACAAASVILHVRATGETRELLAGAVYARYIGDGLLLFVREGQVFVVGFDLDHLTLVGSAGPIEEPVVTRAESGATFLSASGDGAAVFVKGGREKSRTLVVGRPAG